MKNSEIKQSFIQHLYDRGEYIRQVNEIEYQTRCPFCGDSQKNFRTGHLYIRANPEDNFPMVYICFKCQEYGVVNLNFLNIMGIDDLNLKSSISYLNKTSDKLNYHKFLYGDKIVYFEHQLVEIERGFKTQYIENRLAQSFSDEILKKMKVVTSLRNFLISNDIKYITMPKEICFMIEKYYVGFLTFGASHILFRDTRKDSKYPWIKYPITQESKQCRAFYSIQSDIDIFSENTLIINLAEGVFDILSAFSNLGYSDDNIMNIAVCGKHYIGILMILLNMGLVGDNIKLNIFSDNDKVFNTDAKEPTDIEYFKRVLRKMKYLYGSTSIFYNLIGKDIGVPKDKIVLEKYRI